MYGICIVSDFVSGCSRLLFRVRSVRYFVLPGASRQNQGVLVGWDSLLHWCRVLVGRSCVVCYLDLHQMYGCPLPMLCYLSLFECGPVCISFFFPASYVSGVGPLSFLY